jgi:hypothetical protein
VIITAPLGLSVGLGGYQRNGFFEGGTP